MAEHLVKLLLEVQCCNSKDSFKMFLSLQFVLCAFLGQHVRFFGGREAPRNPELGGSAPRGLAVLGSAHLPQNIV